MIGPPGQESLLREILALWRAAPAIAELLPSKMAPKKKSKPTSSGEQPAASSAAPAEFTVPSADKVAIPLPPCDACSPPLCELRIACSQARSKFEHYDKSKSGTLLPSEMITLTRDFWREMHPGAPELTDKECGDKAKELLVSLDGADGGSDGVVEFEEFFPWCAAAPSQPARSPPVQPPPRRAHAL